MDIYSFINSKDIAEHCRTIGHEFTPLEMAFVVYLSDKTLTERHTAWQWIISTQPDMEIPERRCCEHYDSLHQYLRDYMALENKILGLFKADEPNAVFTYSSYNMKYEEPCECDTLFQTLDAVYEAIKEKNKDGDIEKYRIVKRWVGEENKEITIITAYGEVVSVWERCVITDDSLNDLICYGFEGMWIEVPTPFKKGDIVIQTNTKHFHKPEPFVLDYLCYWPDGERFTKEFIERRSKDWDTTDMTFYGYGVSESGHIFREHGHYYLDLEYYRDEQKSRERPLLALGSYIKEKREISEALLLNAYDIVLREGYVQGQRCFSYIDEWLEKAGLKEDNTALRFNYGEHMYAEIEPKDERNWDLDLRESIGPFHSVEEMRKWIDAVDTDIYSFIPSRDIAAHCRALGHEFTPLEQAVIIYHSKKSLSERHNAWQNIIDTLPDMKVTEWSGLKHEPRIYHESLHQFLAEYMRIENRLAERLKAKESDAVYSYSVQDDYGKYTHISTPRSSYDKVIKAIEESSESIDWIAKNSLFPLFKKWIDIGPIEKSLCVVVTTDGEIVGDWCFRLNAFLNETDEDIFTTFGCVNVFVPVPFCKGDVLTYSDGKPFVLTSNRWEYGIGKYPDERQFLAEGSIMDSIISISIEENGNVYNDFNPASLDIEYYRGELKGCNRVLKAISNHMKGKIPTDLMMNAYDIILHEERLKDRLDDLGSYTNEGLALVGLGKTEDEKQ